MVLLVKKLVQMVKMVMPLEPMVQMLPASGTTGRAPKTHSITFQLITYCGNTYLYIKHFGKITGEERDGEMIF